MTSWYRIDKKDEILLSENTFHYAVSLKDVIFLPFEDYIISLFIFLNFVSVHLYLFIMGYEPIITNSFSLIIWIIETSYVIHTSLLILHWCMKSHRKKRVHKPVHMGLVIIDIITVMPFQGISFLVRRFTWENDMTAQFVSTIGVMTKMLRIIRMFIFFRMYTQDPGLNKKIILPLFHFIISSIVAQMLGIYYYSMVCYRCGYPSWSSNLEKIDFDPENDLHWFIICYNYALSVQFHNSTGFLFNTSVEEMLAACLLMGAGFILEFMYLIGSLISEYIQQMRFIFTFENKLSNLNKFMHTLNMSETLKAEVNQYYKTIWNIRRGVFSTPALVGVFPRCLALEISTDIYWEAILHTHIFKYFDDAFKREICAVMKTEIYLAGHYLFRLQEVKSRMCFLAAGILEVMSLENQNSPILSFSTGTILGEAACILPTKCTANIVCATTCEILTLDYKEVCKLMQKFPEASKEIKKRIRYRLYNARKRKEKLKNSNSKISHIFWIKDQWRKLIKINERDTNSNTSCNRLYSSRYLDLLVLPSFDELKVHSICIRGKCPFVMEENSSFRIFIFYICLSSVILQLFITSYMIAFHGKINRTLYPMLTILDMIYLLDIYIQCITAVMVHNVLVTKPSEVLLHRSKQFSFLVDVAASIPYDYFGSLLGTSNYIIGLLRIPKFFKLYKVLLFFFEKENALTPYISLIKFAKFTAIHAIMITLLVCVNYMSNCFMGICLDTGWLTKNKEFIREVYGIDDYGDDYLHTLFHTASIYFSTKTSTIPAYNIIDTIVLHIFYIIGYYITTFAFVQVCAAFSLKSTNTYNFISHLELLGTILNDRRDINYLKPKILEYTTLQWNLNQELYLDDISIMMDQKSSFIKSRIRKEFIQKILLQTELFNGCSHRFLELIASDVELYMVPSGHQIVKCNTRCFHLYIILEGYCVMKSRAPGDNERKATKFCTKYTTFPVVEMLHGIKTLIDVETITAVQLLSLSYLRMRTLLKAMPEENSVFSKCLEAHMKQHRNLLVRRVNDYVGNRPLIVSLGEVNMFRYNIFQTKVPSIKKKIHSQKPIRNWRKFLKIVFWKTYDPNGKFYITYEFIRCFIIILQLIYSYAHLQRSFFDENIQRYSYWKEFFITSLLVDVFMRSHVQYYNEYGIRVSHPWSTFKRYISTSFVIDLLATFPFRIFNVHKLFLYHNSDQAYIFLSLVFRPLQLYRPYYLFSYLKNNVYIRHVLLFNFLEVFGFAMFTSITLACVRLMVSCDVKNDHTFVCPEDYWLNVDPHIRVWMDDYILFLNIYSTMSATIVAAFRMYNARDYGIQLCITMIIVITKLIFLSNLIGVYVHENTKLAQHQDSIKHYLKYIANKTISNKNKLEMLEHFNNYWKKSKGWQPSKIFSSFYPNMQEEIFISLYKPALLNSEVFCDADESFFRLLAPHFEERLFKKEADIIRCNDVQGEIFIVLNGFADVHLAGAKMVTLYHGGMFGCFDYLGITRQTIHVNAKVHVRLLCINTKKFYSILEIYPYIRGRILNKHKLNFEYIPDISEDTTSLSMRTFVDDSRKTNFLLRTISEKNMYFKIWDYITNVHVASCSSIYCLFVMVVYENSIFFSIWITLDIYFLLYIYLRCHVTYTDLESGITVRSVKALTLRYLKSFRFYLDIITILPLYLIHIIFYNGRYPPGYFMGNKLLRISFLFDNYRTYISRRNVPRHIRWVFLIYLAVFILQAVFNVWWLIQQSAINDKDVKIAATYLHIINILTSTGLREETLTHITEIAVNLVVVLVTHCLIDYILAVFSKMLVMQNNYLGNYKSQMELFKIYCHKEQLSNPIITKSWKYLMYLYKRRNGEQLPRLLKFAPPYIRQDHMHTLYKNHFEKHALFKNVHMDFIRQLYLHVKVFMYLPGDMIVETGDINGTMYFVESGEVIAIEKLKIGNNKYKFSILKSHATFGEVQCLYDVRFDKTFKALTDCSILSICKMDWDYLLDWFPASRETLYKEIKNYLPEQDNM